MRAVLNFLLSFSPFEFWANITSLHPFLGRSVKMATKLCLDSVLCVFGVVLFTLNAFSSTVSHEEALAGVRHLAVKASRLLRMYRSWCWHWCHKSDQVIWFSCILSWAFVNLLRTVLFGWRCWSPELQFWSLPSAAMKRRYLFSRDVLSFHFPLIWHNLQLCRICELRAHLAFSALSSVAYIGVHFYLDS